MKWINLFFQANSFAKVANFGSSGSLDCSCYGNDLDFILCRYGLNCMCDAGCANDRQILEPNCWKYCSPLRVHYSNCTAFAYVMKMKICADRMVENCSQVLHTVPNFEMNFSCSAANGYFSVPLVSHDLTL